MKKLKLITVLVALILFAASCKAANTSNIDNAPVVQKPVQNENQVPAKPEEKQPEGPLQLASQGKVTGLQVGVGSRLQEVIAELGEPLELAHFEGSSYVSYQNMNIMLDRIVESTSAEATVIGISISEGYELYGVKVGMTAEEIKKVLGVPTQEYKESEDEADMWKLEYDCGDYKLTFYCPDKNSASTAAYISRIN